MLEDRETRLASVWYREIHLSTYKYYFEYRRVPRGAEAPSPAEDRAPFRSPLSALRPIARPPAACRAVARGGLSRMRGRGGGRGRGRGRGGGGGAFERLRDTAVDLDIDFKSLSGDQMVPPSTYPPQEIPPPMAIDATDADMISSLRYLEDAIGRSPFHVRKQREMPDVERFTEKRRRRAAQLVAAESARSGEKTRALRSRLAEAIRLPKAKPGYCYVPDELYYKPESGDRRSKRRRAKSVDLGEKDNKVPMEGQEQRADGDEAAAEGDAPEEVEQDSVFEYSDEDLDGDYTVDYYESGEDDVNDNGEAIY